MLMAVSMVVFNLSRTTIKLSHIKPRSSPSRAFFFTIRHSSRISEFTPYYFTHVYPTTKRNIPEGLKLWIALIGEGTTNGFSILHHNSSGKNSAQPNHMSACNMYPITLEILKDGSFRRGALKTSRTVDTQRIIHHKKCAISNTAPRPSNFAISCSVVKHTTCDPT